jgi:hypothetical protein
MGYEQWWQTLESLIAELRGRRVAIPANVMSSLRSAKTMINVYKADTKNVDPVLAIENYLLDVESSLINMAKKFGSAFVEAWLKKLDEARMEKELESDKPASQFIAGLPRSEHWIRILPSDDLLRGDVEKLADELGLSHKTQDGYVLVYGEEQKVKEFVKKMAEKCRRTQKG